MSRYRFIYQSTEYDDTDDSPYPSSSTIEAVHDFDSAQTWQCVLWQFCHFLEHTGFEGVRNKVKIDGPLLEKHLFDSYFGENISDKLSVEEYIEALDRHDGDAT